MPTKKKSKLTFPFRLGYKIIFLCYIPFYYLFSTIKKYIVNDHIDTMSGVEFEQYAQMLLQQNGYTHVELTKASNDYGIDIVAMKKDILYAIQCKKYSSKVGIDAIRQASTGCIYYDHDIAVVLTNSTFSSQAKALAMTLDVQLWDHEVLTKLILHSAHAKYRKHIIYSYLLTIASLISGWSYYCFDSSFPFFLLILFMILLLLTIIKIIFMKKDTDYR